MPEVELLEEEEVKLSTILVTLSEDWQGTFDVKVTREDLHAIWSGLAGFATCVVHNFESIDGESVSFAFDHRPARHFIEEMQAHFDEMEDGDLLDLRSVPDDDVGAGSEECKMTGHAVIHIESGVVSSIEVYTEHDKAVEHRDEKFQTELNSDGFFEDIEEYNAGEDSLTIEEVEIK